MTLGKVKINATLCFLTEKLEEAVRQYRKDAQAFGYAVPKKELDAATAWVDGIVEKWDTMCGTLNRRRKMEEEESEALIDNVKLGYDHILSLCDQLRFQFVNSTFMVQAAMGNGGTQVAFA